MKIRCEYCESMYDDTLECCPSCGAKNTNVRKSTSGNPTTIEELKEWYQNMNLPPEDVTRFFIGKNYGGARAFGIYKDERTGNFIVYKNKDDGSRAVRYEGSDEAYAVNELHTRLKQEILQQKGNGSGNSIQNNRSFSSAPPRRRKRKNGFFSQLVSLIIVAIPILLIGKYYMNVRPAQTGYFMCNDNNSKYDGKLFYHYGSDKYGWAVYDEETNDWKKTDSFGYPLDFETRKSAKDYFLSDTYNSSYGGSDFRDSVLYDDYSHNFNVSQGYFSYDDDVYYHMRPNQDNGWYVYDDEYDDWKEISSSSVPADLKHQSVAQDFWYTPTWDSDTQFSDFTETEEFRDYQAELERQAQYEAERNSSSSDNDSSYSWDSSDSWDSGSTDWGSDW